MKHYIIIEVRESGRSQFGATDAGRLRRAMHEFATANQINAADSIVREDRSTLYRSAERTPYAEAKALFRRAMGPQWRAAHPENEDAPWDWNGVR